MTSVLGFLSSDAGAILISGLVAVATWAYHKAKGDSTASLRGTVSGIVDSAIHLAVVTAASHPDDIRAKVTPYVWMTLLRLKVPRNALSESIVNELVEQAISAAISAAKDRDDAGIAANVATAKAEMAKPVPPAPVIPPITGMDVQIVPRDGTEEYKPVGGQL